MKQMHPAFAGRHISKHTTPDGQREGIALRQRKRGRQNLGSVHIFQRCVVCSCSHFNKIQPQRSRKTAYCLGVVRRDKHSRKTSASVNRNNLDRHSLSIQNFYAGHIHCKPIGQGRRCWGRYGIIPADGFLYRTSDGGTTWNRSLLEKQQLKELASAAHKVQYVSENTAYLMHYYVGAPTDDTLKYPHRVRSIAHLRKTTDNGEIWSLVHELEDYGLEFYFLSPDIGFLQSAGDILKTSDGGQTWIKTNFGNLSAAKQFEASDFIFTRPNVGFVVAAADTVFVTLDGGDNWNIQPTPSYRDDNWDEGRPILYGVRQTDDSTFYFIGSRRFIEAKLPRGLRGTLGIVSSTEEPAEYNPYLFLSIAPHSARGAMSAIAVHGLYSPQAKNKELKLKIYNFFGVVTADLSQEANRTNTGIESRVFLPPNLPPRVYVAEVEVAGARQTLPFVVQP